MQIGIQPLLNSLLYLNSPVGLATDWLFQQLSRKTGTGAGQPGDRLERAVRAAPADPIDDTVSLGSEPAPLWTRAKLTALKSDPQELEAQLSPDDTDVHSRVMDDTEDFGDFGN